MMHHDLCSQRLEYVAVAGALAALAGAAARLSGRMVILVVLEGSPPTFPAKVHQSLGAESGRPGHRCPATQGHWAPRLVPGEGTTGISRAAPNQAVVGCTWHQSCP